MKKFFQLICSFFVALAFNACVEDFKIGDKFLEKYGAQNETYIED